MRKTACFFGRVQGVGFRYTVEMIARHHTVTGCVSNMEDGSVEVVAEGEAAVLAAFMQAIQEARNMNISSVVERDEPATGEFYGFHTRP
jgi:acylphosphatase